MAPKEIGGAKVLMFSYIDARHKHTGACRQIVGGELMGPARALAICQYVGDQAYYLFGCDENWNSVTDTWHESIDDAKRQAEFEYAGVMQTWQELD